MKEQLTDTWRINSRMNLLLMDNIIDSGMEKTLSTRGGRTVYQHSEMGIVGMGKIIQSTIRLQI